MAALSRRAEYLPITVIVCFRPAPRSAELDQLTVALEAASGRYLNLGGLAGQAVAELTADAVGAVPGPDLLAGLSAAAGNPLFVIEMLGALAREGLLGTAGGRAEVTQIVLPPTLRLTILRRLSFLSGDMLQALRMAAVLGSSFTVTDLSVTMDRPVSAGPDPGRRDRRPGARRRRRPAPVSSRPDPRRRLRGSTAWRRPATRSRRGAG